MPRFFFVFFLMPFYSFSQNFTTTDRPELTIEPDPYIKVYFQNTNDYKKIESVTTIVRNRKNGFKSDTSRISHYNGSGLEFKTINFKDNKPGSTMLNNYTSKGDLVSWQLFEKNFSTLCIFSYSKDGKTKEANQIRIEQKNGKPDSIETSRTIFKYMGLKVKEILFITYGKAMTERYAYSKNKLLYKLGGYISKSFQHDEDGNLTSVQEYMGDSIVPSKLMGLKKFNYDLSKKLVEDSVLTGSNLQSKKYQVCQYSYNENGNLEIMRCQFDTAYRNVNFIYANNRIEAINLETNINNSAYLKFWIDHDIQYYYTFPIAYKELFNYDEHRNRISKKVYVNNNLFSEIEYKIKYKK